MKQFTLTCHNLNIIHNFMENDLKLLTTPPVWDPRWNGKPIWADVDALGQDETFTFHYNDKTWEITRVK